MDTSQKYIDMCRKARELQEMWRPSLGDHVYKTETEKVVVLGNMLLIESSMCYPRYRYTDGTLDLKDSVWLPRIDQLAALYDDWSRFCNMCEFIDTHNIVSFEQAGLMAVMERQYKMEWNGEDWICTSNSTA